MRVLVIGCGECGSRLAEQLAIPRLYPMTKDKPKRLLQRVLAFPKSFGAPRGLYPKPVFPIIVNTTRLDMWQIAPSRISEAHWINVDEARVVRGLEKGETILGGCGARRDYGKAIFKHNEHELLEAIWECIPDPQRQPPNLVLITGSLGGGTGSSFTPLLAKGVHSLILDRVGVRPPIIVLGVLPVTPPHEKSMFTQNAAECLREIYEANVVSGLCVVDNELWTDEHGIEVHYPRINLFATYQLLPLFQPPGSGRIIGQSLDAEDVRSHVRLANGLPGLVVAGSSAISGGDIEDSFERALSHTKRFIELEEGARWNSGFLLLRLSDPLQRKSMMALEEMRGWLQNHSRTEDLGLFTFSHPEGRNDITIVLSYSPTDSPRLVAIGERAERRYKDVEEDEKRKVSEWLHTLPEATEEAT